MADIYQRKLIVPVPSVSETRRREDDKPTTTKRAAPDLEPSLSVMIGMLFAFFSLVGLFVGYKVSHANGGTLATYINKHYPVVPAYLHHPSPPLFGASAQATTGQLTLTEDELKAFDGTDAEKPILLAINGTIFDVSSSPSFYGPGGHYHHFVGKDASRAWVTECWDAPEQFTWRMDGVEAMFMTNWMDELLETAAAGQLDSSIVQDIKMVTPDMLANMAKKALERYGAVTPDEMAQRRVQDKIDADAKVHETLDHWVRFFASNPKYKVVGTVIHDTDKPDPPAPCAEALKKRPMKGGKLESMMGTLGKFMGGDAGKKAADAAKMPDFVKDKVAAIKDKFDGDTKSAAKPESHEEL